MKPKLIFAAVLVGVGLGLAMPFFAKHQDAAAQQQKDQKWEYKVEQFQCSSTTTEDSGKQMQALANAGWEYVGLVAVPGGGYGNPPRQEPTAGYVAFKRLKK
jgi:hypothetical protein